MRETHEWTDAELEYLQLWYALRGSAFIRAKYPALSADSIRQQATRLYLADDLTEFTPLRTVARDAGVTPQSVLAWVRRRKWAMKRCTGKGNRMQLPLPVVRLYLHEHRRDRVPRGWPSAAQAAPRLKTSLRDVQRRCESGALSCITVRGGLYVDPSTLPQPHRLTVPPGYVHLPTLAREASMARKTLSSLPTVAVKGSRGRPAQYASPHHVRAFLSQREHHAEQIDTLIRRAQGIDVSRTKDVRSDTGES